MSANNPVSQAFLQKRFCDSIERVSKSRNQDVQKYFKFSTDKCGLTTLREKSVQASLLNNFSNTMSRFQDNASTTIVPTAEIGQQFTTSANFGPYVPEIWPVIVAWYPEFPLKELISVQDMEKPLDYLFFSKLLTGTTKADTTAGEVVETPLGSRTIRGRYPTGEVFGEQIPADQIDFESGSNQTTTMLNYYPLSIINGYLQRVKLTITSSDSAINGEFIPLNVQGDFIHLAKTTTPDTDSGITIQMSSGVITIPDATGSGSTTVTEIVANYVWNLDYAQDATIPKVIEDIQMVPMEATPRALAMDWTIFSEYLKKSQFGVDIREDNTKRILSLLYQYQLRYILDTMYDYATGNNSTEVAISIPGGTSVSLDVKAQQVMQALKGPASMIETESGRMEGNRIVTGRNLKNFLETLPSTWWTPVATPDGYSSPRKIGTFGTFDVYYDPNRDDNEAFICYKGSEWFDSTYYLGVFMPIVPTDAIALGVQVRQAFCSMEAHMYHKPNCVIRLDVTYA